MNDSKPAANTRSREHDGKISSHQKCTFPVSSFGYSSTYFTRNVEASSHSHYPMYYAGSYNFIRHPTTLDYNHPSNQADYNIVDFPSSHKMASRFPTNCDQNWNRMNLPSPLTVSAAKGLSTSKSRPEGSCNTNRPTKNVSSSTPKPSNTTSSNIYNDPNILEAARALELPSGNQKFSVSHWKGAMKLCYRWKTTTNEYERQFYRSSTSTNSLSSSTLKSIKFFCENIMKRKSKRRQFAIHWKESGLKKMVDEGASSESDDAFIGHNHPKLETIVDDYFSGRTRSSEYNKAKEKVLENRQKEIIHLWNELMNGPLLSEASSYQKLYLIQLAIERPYRKEKVEIETTGQKVTHDVAIEGYGGDSYWENNDFSLKDGTSRCPGFKSYHDILPVNNAMINRFWKSANSFQTPERQCKRRRMEDGDESKISKEISTSDCILPEKNLNVRENDSIDKEKENERSSVVAV